MTVPHWPSLLLSALCLSGCAAGPSGEAVGRRPANDVEQDQAVASLPAAAGRVVAVRRIPYANGFGQEIVLDGPRAMSGENLIRVQALTTASTGLRGQGAEELRLGPPTDTEVAAEMDRALPGVAMRVAAAPERGENGTVGYATGAVGRLSCVYAWQYLAPARPLSLFEGAAGTGALPVSVRVRLCREQPLATVVAILRGLRVSHQNGTAQFASRLPASGGDALTAAAGAERPLPARDGEVAGGEDRSAEPIGATGPAQPQRGGTRKHRHAAALQRRHDPRAVTHAVQPAIARRRGDAGGPLGAPRVPMPGEASATAAPPPGTATALQPQRSMAADAMPMPH